MSNGGQRRSRLGDAALGRGVGSNILDALRGRGNEGAQQVPVDQIQPNRFQPREDIAPEDLADLAESIRANGLLQAPLVRPLVGGGFEMLAGERRWRAVQLLGWQQIPVTVREVDDTTAAVLAIVENADREGLTAWEEAQAVANVRGQLELAGRPNTLQDMEQVFGWSSGKISERVTIADGISREIMEAAGLDLHAVKKLSKSALLNASRAGNTGEKVRLLRLGAGVHEDVPPAAARKARGRPREAFTLRTPKSGRLTLQMRKSVRKMEPTEASQLLEKLEPVVDQLRRRARGEEV